ncbi:DUF2238 domain-containing protein [Candidatus Woesearchaeota archaeon]|jgi:putative membrane protein|nr:DUF2238 domain-containing protein [Candidatus Woesearchaeota archaeon]MBT4336436.1 DUF2238 domain-containing protein [Candidatus Woesearchaeota archaeon]MBT4469849.1 DUF2238 domain-containing protein [Candidatus Woesearchaeota archaeon]MBT6744480.1 DUF2238 domain-containing protein [Candidatus Woesearchaeota archaeon]
MKEVFNKKNYPRILLGVFLVFWIIVAISPLYRGVWIAENILTVLFVGFLILTYKKFKFSNLSYTLLFAFLVLHTIGSQYSYTEMPLFELIRDSFGLARNYYDRVVHFLFGLIFFIPGYEFISKKLKIKGFWAFFLTFLAVVSLQSIFEVIEFAFILITRSEIIGTHYLGMQGDQWDAQKDMALGILGSALAWLGLLLKNPFKKKK